MQSPDELKVYLSDRVNKIADDYNVKLSTKAYDARFQELIETLGKPGKTVILIDEYDKPILDNITNKDIGNIRETLESFYSVSCWSKLKLWYDSYRFEEDAEPVYNPVSIGKSFESGGEFKNYWFETGTPSFPLKLAKKQQFDFEKELSWNAPVTSLIFRTRKLRRHLKRICILHNIQAHRDVY